MNRTLRVIGVQLVNRQTHIWVPLLVLGGSWVLSMAVHFTLNSAGVASETFSGGAQAPLWYFLFVGVHALTLTFPFSQAMSVTLREFYLGTLLTAILTSVLMSLVFVTGGLIESATGGWGVGVYFFALPWIWDVGWWAACLLYFAIAIFFFMIGFWGATIYKRFSSIGLTIVLLALGFVLVAVMWLIGQLQAWGTVFSWIGAQGTLGISLWGLVLVAVLAASAFPMFRRLVP